jgi:hypothetical protein
MPDRGFWTLRCQGCGKDFTLEVLPGEHIVDFAKAYICPYCKRKPEEHTALAASWHHIVDFHAKHK